MVSYDTQRRLKRSHTDSSRKHFWHQKRHCPASLMQHSRTLQERAAASVGGRAARERQVLSHCAGCKKPLSGERVVLGSGEVFHAACLRCHECRHEIGQGAFILVDNVRFHRACFVCQAPNCGALLADIGHFRHRGRNLCRSHYEDIALPRCAKCNEPLRSDYVTFSDKSEPPGFAPHIEKQLTRLRRAPCEREAGKKGTLNSNTGEAFCLDCFKCAECKVGLAGKKFYVQDGLPYCENDYGRLFALKCKACGRALWGNVKIHESGELYCIPCELHEPCCSTCGRLVWTKRAKHEINHPIDLPDGRILCEVCVVDAVFSPLKADECFDHAKRFVHFLLGRERCFTEHLRAKTEEHAVSGSEMDDVPLLLVDRMEMATLCYEHGCHHIDGHLHTSPMGITLLQREVFACNRDMTAMGTTRLLRRPAAIAGTLTPRTVTRAVRGIRALNALPPMLLTATLVHELLHFHMFVVGNFRPNPPPVEEGICELAALLYLRSLPQDKERDIRIRQRLENPSKVYGDGLRAAERKWRAMGSDRKAFKCLLQHVKAHQSF